MNSLAGLRTSVVRPWMRVLARGCQTAEKSEKTKMVRPTAAQRYYLLWSKTYKTADDIPSEVSYTKLKRATDWARIRINIAMCVAVGIGCIAVIYGGKKEKSWGYSVQKENLDWHKKNKEAAKASASK